MARTGAIVMRDGGASGSSAAPGVLSPDHAPGLRDARTRTLAELNLDRVIAAIVKPFGDTEELLALYRRPLRDVDQVKYRQEVFFDLEDDYRRNELAAAAQAIGPLAASSSSPLGLGSWLGTTDGQVITTAVESVTPPFYRQEVELLVEGLKLAAESQQAEGQRKAGTFAIGTIGVAAVLALMIFAFGEGRTN